MNREKILSSLRKQLLVALIAEEGEADTGFRFARRLLAGNRDLAHELFQKGSETTGKPTSELEAELVQKLAETEQEKTRWLLMQTDLETALGKLKNIPATSFRQVVSSTYLQILTTLTENFLEIGKLQKIGVGFLGSLKMLFTSAEKRDVQAQLVEMDSIIEILKVMLHEVGGLHTILSISEARLLSESNLLMKREKEFEERVSQELKIFDAVVANKQQAMTALQEEMSKLEAKRADLLIKIDNLRKKKELLKVEVKPFEAMKSVVEQGDHLEERIKKANETLDALVKRLSDYDPTVGVNGKLAEQIKFLGDGLLSQLLNNNYDLPSKKDFLKKYDKAFLK